jgi:hypothetical protein
MLKQIALATILTLAVCGFAAGAVADNTNGNTAAAMDENTSTNTNGNNGWGNGGGDGTTPGSDKGNGFGMTIDDHGNTRFHGLESGTKSSPQYGR